MTPRGTDWWLAALVALLAISGIATWFSATPSERWVYAVHDAGGIALGGVLIWKFRRVWRRVLDTEHWDRRTGAGLAAGALVGGALGSGVAWSTGASTSVAGYTLLAWHAVFGAMLAVVVLGHAIVRAKPLRPRDVADRRQFFATIGVGAGAVVAWRVQRPVSRALGLGGENRRFTGSYSDDGRGEFPVTSWVADDPRELDGDSYRLEIDGEADTPLRLAVAELDLGDELVATLDCTGGFACTRRWSGVRLDRLVGRARAARVGEPRARALEDRLPRELRARRGGRDPAGDQGGGRSPQPRPRRSRAPRRAEPPRFSVGQMGHPDRARRRPGPGGDAVDRLEQPHA